MQTTFLSRYATALLPLGVAVFGVFDAAQKTGTTLLGWQTLTQLILLVATTGAAYWLPLVPGKWAGALKTGAAIVGAIASALIATVPDGHFTSATWILFLTAAFKAVAVQLGVTIRVDAAKVIDAGSTSDPGVPSITSLAAPAAALTAADLVVPEPDTEPDSTLPATFEEAQDLATAVAEDTPTAETDAKHAAAS